jgi:phosphatidylserine/phosphatidylglycerophosphate/cardiolipin synthase-like enzyme
MITPPDLVEDASMSLEASNAAFHVTPWERYFLAKMQSATRIVRLACPFIKLRNIRLILSALSGTDEAPLTLQILTRLNLRDCRSHVHDISALELLVDNPIERFCNIDVRFDNLLHAKLYIFDDSEAIVTSSNLTYAGFYRNLEVAISCC